MNAGSLLVFAMLLATVIFAHATQPPAFQTTGAPKLGIEALEGRWIVDLRPSPEAPRYQKLMVLNTSPDQSIRGLFYESTIEAGRISTSNGRICFAFRTTDGNGPYQTSGCIVGDRIFGQTWAEHRKFILNWTAERE